MVRALGCHWMGRFDGLFEIELRVRLAVFKADEVDWQVYVLGLLGNCMVYIAKTPRERYKG